MVRSRVDFRANEYLLDERECDISGVSYLSYIPRLAIQVMRPDP